MASSPSITVICSNYNSIRWIDGYLDALNRQTFPRFEIIFVDACSTDGSLEKIRQFRSRPGISASLIATPQRITIYDAWNLAIKRATGTYVVNINTDDRLYPGGLATYASYAAVYPLGDVFYGACNIVEDPDHKRVTGIYRWPEYSHQALLRRCICGPFPMVKKASLLEDGLFDPSYTISGDYEMWLRMSARKRKFINVQDTIGSYFLNPAGVSTNNSPQVRREHVRQDKKIRSIYLNLDSIGKPPKK